MSKTIVINGRHYDTITGQPVDRDNTQPVSSSAEIHAGVQKSQTLNRRFVSAPNRPQTTNQVEMIRQFKRKHDYAEARKKAEAMNLEAARNRAANSPRIARFNPGVGSAQRVITPINRADEDPIAPATPHPLQQKAQAQTLAQKQTAIVAPSLREQKDQAISQALEKAQASNQADRSNTKRRRSRSASPTRSLWRQHRFAGYLAGTFAIVLTFGYLTYINMPNISTRIAAAQAGIEASMPNYSPSGYTLNGLASFDGESVNLTYASARGNFTIKQSKSYWDSLALLDNYVEKEWQGNYMTIQEKGITIYSNNGEAAWVNSGIVYKISGDNNLTNDQIRKIATSF